MSKNTIAFQSKSDSEEHLQSKECHSIDRKCVRCMLYNWEAHHEQDAYLGKDKFTRSFSPSDSFEDIFSIEDECDAETRVLFCKSLNVTSDEDEDKKGIKRTYEDRRDDRCFVPSKKPCKFEHFGLHQIPSNHSYRSLRGYSSPISEQRSKSSTRRSKQLYTRSVSSRSDLSTKTQSDGPNWNSRSQKSSWEAKPIGKSKKKRDKENLSANKNERAAVHEKKVVIVRSSDNVPVGKSSERSGERRDPPTIKPQKLKSQNSPRALRDAVQKSTSMEKTEGRVKKVQTPEVRGFLEEICEKTFVPPSRVEIDVLPAIEEKLESQSSMSTETDSFSASDSFKTTSSADGSGHKPKTSMIKANFGNVSIKRRTRSVFDKSGRPKPKVHPNSCLKRESKSAPSKRISKKSVGFSMDAVRNGADEELVQKRSAKLEKHPSALKTTKSDSKSRHSSDYVTAPAVILSIDHSTHLRNERAQVLDGVANRRNGPLRLFSDLGFLGNFDRGICAVYAPRFPVIHRPPSVRITELKEDPYTDTDTKSCSNDHENKQILPAISDMVMEMNKQANECLFGKKAISAGPSNAERKQQLTSQASLEERRRQIRRKMGRNSGLKVVDGGNIGDQRLEMNQLVKSQSKTDEQQPRAKGSPQQRARGFRARKIRTGNELENVGMPQEEDTSLKQQCSTPRDQSPSFQAATILRQDSESVLRNKARSNAMRNLFPANNGNTDSGWPSSGTGSITEGFPALESDYVSLESHSGESYETAGTRRRLSPRRPPSRRPHLSPSNRRAAAANTKPIQKSPCPPRTLLTMQMQSKPDPNTTSAIREQLGTEIEGIEQLKERSITATKTFTDGMLGTIATKKRAGHPLQNRTLQDFIEERKRILSNREIHGIRFPKRMTTSSSHNRNC